MKRPNKPANTTDRTKPDMRVRVALSPEALSLSITGLFFIPLLVLLYSWLFPAGFSLSHGIIFFLSLILLLRLCWSLSLFLLGIKPAQSNKAHASRPSDARPLKVRRGQSPHNSDWRCALIFPVYNENPAHVIANCLAVAEDLCSLPRDQKKRFDVFLLSDSDSSEVWLQEEWLWWQVQEKFEKLGISLFYRHRPSNLARKSGNIADFCKRWGGRYRYFTVLDADSLMTAETLLEALGRMEEDGNLGLLQIPPRLVRGSTYFARFLQISSILYATAYNRGLAFFQGRGGNYWGHNAVVRMEAFVSACGLPSLKGKSPWGGEILSHDIVEAALLLRAGWSVEMASDLTGSFEEAPPNLLQFWRRDRRWCQGNLQHLRLLLRKGWKAKSRLYYLDGAFAYLSAPLWLLLIVFLVLDYVKGERLLSSPQALPLGALTAVVLFAPKVFVLAEGLVPAKRREAFGGIGSFVQSWFAEFIFGVVLAPIALLAHSTMVVSFLLGVDGGWSKQDRHDERLSFLSALRLSIIPLCLAALISVFMVYGKFGVWEWMFPFVASWFAAPLLIWGSSKPYTFAKKNRVAQSSPGVPERGVVSRAEVHFRRLQDITEKNIATVFLENPDFIFVHKLVLLQSTPHSSVQPLSRPHHQSAKKKKDKDALYALLHDMDFVDDVLKKASLAPSLNWRKENRTSLLEELLDG